jgi:Rod binding domain-containing protein
MDNNINISNNITIQPLNTPQDIKQVAEGFEELFIQQLLKTSLNNIDIAGASAGSDIVKDMYLNNIAKSTAGSMGISQILIEHLSNK